MLPANQRFQPYNPPRGQLDFRLVKKYKLTLLQRLAQVRLARPNAGHRLGSMTVLPATFPENFAHPAQLQLAGCNIGQALQHAQFLCRHRAPRLTREGGERAQNPAVTGANRNAGK